MHTGASDVVQGEASREGPWDELGATPFERLGVCGQLEEEGGAGARRAACMRLRVRTTRLLNLHRVSVHVHKSTHRCVQERKADDGRK